MIEIAVGRRLDLERAEADVVERLICKVRKRRTGNRLSMQNVWSVFSTNWCTESVALYGSTTVSDTLGDGTTE